MSDALSAPRSYTDPFSNLVVLSSLDLKRHLAQIYDKDIPLSCLPTFLHEVTHHWCFTSPVGFASLLLFFRARREAFRHFRRGKDRNKLYDVLDAVLRYDCAQGMMRPLAEGMALFAEHDACTGFTKTISEPMVFAGTLFARGVAVRSKPVWGKLPMVLAGARLTPLQIRRKADLLMQPLSTTNGGYLPGYLLIKNQWIKNVVGLGCSHFMDTDFYLQFIRSYFYDDWVLVARMLDPGLRDIGALGPISERVQVRLNSFVREKNRQEQAVEFERSSLAGRPLLKCTASLGGLYFPYSEWDTPDEETIKGKERLKALHQELFSAWPEDDAEQMLVDMDLEIIKFWSTINLAHTVVGGEVENGDLKFLENGLELFSTKAPEHLQNGWKGEMDVDIMVDTTDYGMFGFVSSEGKLLDSWKLGNKDAPDHLRTPQVHAKSRIHLMQSSQNLLTEAMGNKAIEIERDHARREVERLTESIYTARAVPCLSDQRGAEVRQLMVTDGLLPLLGGDLRLLSDAAAASLCKSVDNRPEAVSSFHRWSGDNPLQAIANIASKLDSFEILSFVVNEGRITGSAI